jgi:hypothetical protein
MDTFGCTGGMGSSVGTMHLGFPARVSIEVLAMLPKADCPEAFVQLIVKFRHAGMFAALLLPSRFPLSLPACCRLRRKYEAWSEQFQQRMQGVQDSLLMRRRPGRPPAPTVGGGDITKHTSASQGVPGTSSSHPAVQSIVLTSGADEVAHAHQTPVPDQQHSIPAISAGSDAAVMVADPAAVHKPSTPVQVAVNDATGPSPPDVPGSGGNPESKSVGRTRKRDKLRKLLFH